MTLINDMIPDTNGGVYIKTYIDYYTPIKTNMYDVCYSDILHVTGNVSNGLYVLPYIGTGITLDIYDEANCLILSGETMSDWVDNYINSLASTGYTSYDDSTIENRILYDSSDGNYYYIEHIYYHTGDTTERWAIINNEDETIWNNSGSTYYFNELDDCGNDTGRQLIILKNINNFSNTYNTIKYAQRCAESLNLPSVSIMSEVLNLTYNTATVNGSVSSYGDYILNKRGFCYSIFSSPTIDDFYVDVDNGGLGSFSYTFNNLISGNTYYVRAYAKYSGGIVYSDEISFDTLTVPVLTTKDITDIDFHEAKCGGIITDDGGSPIIDLGVCINVTGSPDITNTLFTSDDGIVYDFNSSLNNLSAQTVYYARAFAKNEVGISYGDEKSFTTNTLTIPSTYLSGISDITNTGSTVYGEVKLDGGSDVTSRGFCYSITPNPTTNSNLILCGSGLGKMNGELTGLINDTIYYVKAFANNIKGTSYSNQLDFKTLRTPDVVVNWEIQNNFLYSGTFQIYLNGDLVVDLEDSSDSGVILTNIGDIIWCVMYSNDNPELISSDNGNTDHRTSNYYIESIHYTVKDNHTYTFMGRYNGRYKTIIY